LIVGSIHGTRCIPLKGSSKVHQLSTSLGVSEWGLQELVDLRTSRLQALLFQNGASNMPNPQTLTELRNKAQEVLRHSSLAQ